MSKDIQDVTYQDSRNVMWAAIKAAKERIAALEAGKPVSTVDKAAKEATSTALSNASKVSVDSIAKVLTKMVDDITSFTNQYADLETAIAEKKAELKDVHAIEVSANDLAALVAVKQQLIDEKNTEAEEIIDSAEKEAGETLEEATHEAETKINQADMYYAEKVDEANKLEAIRKQEREREEEQYSYSETRKRKIEADRVADELAAKAKSLDVREFNLKIREDVADEMEENIENLNKTVAALEASIKTKVDEAFAAGEEKAKKSASFQANIIKSSADADAKIAASKIESLEDKVMDLQEQIVKANNLVANANSQVAEMARAALKAQADVATVNEVSKIVANAGNNKNK